jgi:hypothetical protein
MNLGPKPVRRRGPQLFSPRNTHSGSGLGRSSQASRCQVRICHILGGCVRRSLKTVLASTQMATPASTSARLPNRWKVSMTGISRRSRADITDLLKVIRRRAFGSMAVTAGMTMACTLVAAPSYAEKPSATPASEQPDMVSALTAAKKLGKNVKITGQTTERSASELRLRNPYRSGSLPRWRNQLPILGFRRRRHRVTGVCFVGQPYWQSPYASAHLR